MTLKAKVANALSFAQMAGFGRAKAAKAKADDDEDKKEEAAKADAESEEEEASAKAESDDEKKKDDDEEKESKKAKKAEKKDNDNDGDADDVETASASAERARCKAIVAHGVKTGQVVHACAYAFDTDMTPEAAVATLDANLAMQPAKSQGASLRERMSTVDTPIVQPDGGAPAADSPQAIAAMVIAAAAKARGEKA